MKYRMMHQVIITISMAKKFEHLHLEITGKAPPAIDLDWERITITLQKSDIHSEDNSLGISSNAQLITSSIKQPCDIFKAFLFHPLFFLLMS